MVLREFSVLGIDPGVSGGIALVSGSKMGGGDWEFSVVGGYHGLGCHYEDDFACLGVQRKKIVNGNSVSHAMRSWGFESALFVSGDPCPTCVIERQQDRNDQSGGSQMMFNYGRWSLSAEDYFGRAGVFYASPSKWKGDMGLTRDKGRSISVATRIFGDSAASDFWPRKKDDGVAEAALLALWRIRKLAESYGSFD